MISKMNRITVFGLDGNVDNSPIALEEIVDVSRSNSFRETPHPDGKAVFAHSKEVKLEISFSTLVFKKKSEKKYFELN